MARSQARDPTLSAATPSPRRLVADARGTVPLRIAPLVIIGLILLVMAMLAATTL